MKERQAAGTEQAEAQAEDSQQEQATQLAAALLPFGEAVGGSIGWSCHGYATQPLFVRGTATLSAY